MCGVIGIYAKNPVSMDLYESLIMLQHRGQDAAGIVSCELNPESARDIRRPRLHRHRARGLVRDAFKEEHLDDLFGNAGIAHVRYPTAGAYDRHEVQPFYVNSPYGIAMAHNGNLVNSDQLLKESFVDNGRRRIIYTESDSEILINMFARGLLEASDMTLPGPKEVFGAVRYVHQQCQGAYAVVALLAGIGLVAFRDPHAIRPLVLGQRENKRGMEYMLASESVALDLLSYRIVDDLEAGEAVFIDNRGDLHRQVCADNEQIQHRSCIFEYVYFSRPDSVIDNVYVHKARMRMGSALAKKIKAEWDKHEVDVVIPVPDTSRTAALEIASSLRTKYREGFIKNRYIERTFIMASQDRRDRSVRYKLNPLGAEFKNKNVLLVDDSIVRGTTSRQIVQLAREAGANRVYFASASPAIRHPNVYGIDMRSNDELIAHNKKTEEVCDAIGADRLIYQDLDELVAAVRCGNRKLKQFDCSMFDGKYCPGHTVNKQYFSRLYQGRSAQKKRGAKGGPAGAA